MPAAFVQSKSAATGGVTSTTIAVTLASAITSGNLACGLVTWESSDSATLTSITDDKGNTYTIQRRLVDTVELQAGATFFLPNITNGPITITSNFSSALPNRAVSVHEASGVAKTNPLDVETGQIQTVGTTATDGMTSGSVTTVSKGDYVFGGTIDQFAKNAAPHWNAGTGYTKREETSSTSVQNMASEDQIQSVSGSIAGTFTQIAPADKGITFILTFKAASGVTPRSLALLGVGS